MVAQNEDPTQGHKADLLLVTATEVETRAVLKMFSLLGSTIEQYHIDGSTYFDLGVIGERELFWCNPRWVPEGQLDPLW